MNSLELFDASRIDRQGLFNRDRLLSEIAAQGLDAVVASTAENVTYTSGAYIGHLLGPMFVLTSADGEQAMVVNEADAYYARDASWISTILPFDLGADSLSQALTLLAEAMAQAGLNGGRIGIERSSIPWAYFEGVTSRAPNASFEDGSAVFRAARVIKTEGEIELIEAAATATAKAIAAGLATARPGDTEKTLQASIQANVLRLGADSLAHAHVHSGVHSTVVHTHSVENPIKAGEVIHIDFGGVFGGYHTDLARNAVVGGPSHRQSDIYKKLWEVQDVLYQAVKPGVLASELYELSEEAHSARGLEYPWSTAGHSVGLSVHEGFELSKESETELQPGMVFNLEPSHIEAGDARYHAEDTVLVTEGGARCLSDFGREAELFRIT